MDYALTEKEIEATHPTRRTQAANPARLPVVLASIFIVALPFPGIINLPAGASPALVTMLVSIPFWYEAARARNTPFDQIATRAISVILTSAGFLIIWSLLSTFGADAPLRASRHISTLIAAFAIYFLVRGTVTRAHLVFYVDVLATLLAATAAVSLLAFEINGLHEIIFRGTDRAAGFFKNPNQFGMAISTTVPAVMALFLAERQRRPLRALCLLMLLLGLVASGSKTNLLLAWASILAVLFGYSFITHSGARRMGMLMAYLFGSVVFAGLGIIALTLLNPRALGIMSEFFSGEGKIDSLMTRSFLWTYSLDQFLADPILGQGAGQRIDIFYREADVAHSHNVLLDYMRTLGAPGLLGVSIMIGAVMVVCLMSIGKALRSQSGAPPARIICLGLSFCCLSYVAANMSSDSFGPSTSPFFWLFTYLALVARRLMCQPTEPA
ncbi:MAG: O-antigen ligase family protein [Paracoccaceae bacterium]|nr:O-antigen ligase family protein [Paracoccaceae bacterium]